MPGIKRSETQVAEFLKTSIYLAQEIEPSLTEAQAGRQAVFFMDAAYFVLALFLGFLGLVARIFIHNTFANYGGLS